MGLAYEAEIAVNWCQELGTVLANEEVINGKSERGGHPVVKMPMRQWVLKITAYAERLLHDLEDLDWPDAIKEMQRNWIGKSIGAEVDFEIADCALQIAEKKIRIFTTRPDTLFGATYMVLAPEHKLVSQITTEAQKKQVQEYVEKSARKSDLERTDLAKEKTGVFTGAYAINPVNQEKIPIWIADYVLISYGTGAIMAVPAHDERDFDFAQKFELKIQVVILSMSSPNDSVGDPNPGFPTTAFGNDTHKAFTGVGICIHSETPDKSFSINGLKSDEAKLKITDWLESKKIGKKSIQYKLRDWLFSRQRYWGEPIPIVHCPKCGIVLGKEEDLPIRLPEMTDFKPTGTSEPPLAKAGEWLNTKCPKCGSLEGKRETNTMPQWAGSCWYYLRYIDPENAKQLVDSQKEKYWMNVDLYVGGAEHAVLHLLYSRFWHKVLYDLGVVSTKEPFQRLINQGMILGEDNQKMSKSRGNVVSPDEMMERYGADSIRLYEMFMGPLEMSKPWSTQGLEGVSRFLARVWRLFVTQDYQLNPAIKNREPTPLELKRLHQTIKKVTEDMEGIRLNTAISAFMVFINETLKDQDCSRQILEKFILLLAPFAPHLSEEIWQLLGHAKTLAYEPWPRYEEKYLIEEEVEMAVLIGGKVRTKMTVQKGLSNEAVEKQALGDPRVQEWIQGKEIKQIVVVPGRIVNIVTK